MPSGVDGITHIIYEVRIYDGKGNAIGYKQIKNPKTVYDPKKYSDEQMLDMAQQAAAQKYEDMMRNNVKQVSSTVNGIQFRVYMEHINNKNTGVITNVHPE